MEVNPIAVILVYMDSKGDRLLYRYPYHPERSTSVLCGEALNGVHYTVPSTNALIHDQKRKNPYAIISPDDVLQTTPQNTSNICPKGQLHGLTDQVLSTLFAVKSQLCNQKFELKINDVRFVSHPTLIQRKEHRGSISGASAGSGNTNANTTTAPAKATPQILINVIFALHAQASYSIVKCYCELSKRLGLTLKVEEQRIGYVSEEIALMIKTHDEISSQEEQNKQQDPQHVRVFDLISERSTLAQAIKSIYHDLCTTGLLNTTINQSITLSFCLPQKAHQFHKKGSMVDPETIDRCLRSLKPYHGMLLLVDFAELLDCVPPAGARMLLQLVEVYNPLMSLQNMASDADLSIEHVNKIVCHLVYWAKATIIYPLCETNVYVIAPDSALHTKSHLVEKFSTRFPGMSLFEVISDFSLPTSIGHLTTPLQQPARQGILAQMVLWMLQHHLLMQLHTYVQFMPSDLDDLADEDDCQHEDDDDDDAASASASGSLLDLNDVGSMANEEILIPENRGLKSVGGASDDDINAGSLLSMSSQPLPVPNPSRRSITEGQYSAGGSIASDNIAVQPSSSQKSNFSMTASLSTENCDSIASIEDEQKVKELLNVFEESDRAAIRRIPASMNVDDLTLMVKLYQAGYFKSEHHLEEIMYFENLRRSQLLQLLDKFRDVLIIYETEDPAIASMYNNDK